MPSRRCARKTLYLGGVKLGLRGVGVWMLVDGEPVRVRCQEQFPDALVKVLVSTTPGVKPTAEDFEAPQGLMTTLDVDGSTVHGRPGRNNLNPLSASKDPVLWQALTGRNAYVTAAELALATKDVKLLELDRVDQVAPAALDVMARSRDWSYRWHVASSELVSPQTLTWMAKKEGSYQVRCVIAANPVTPPDVLAWMLRDRRDEVLVELAKNPNTPPAALVQLAAKPAAEEAAARNRNLPVSVVDEWIIRGRADLALLSPHMDLERFERLALSEDPYVLGRLAGHVGCPEHLLTKLAYSGNQSVLSNVAANPFSPPAVLLQLAAIRNESVAYHLAKNPSLPVEAVEDLASWVPYPVLFHLASNQATPSRALAPMVTRDSSVHLVIKAMENPNVGSDTLKEGIRILGPKSKALREMAWRATHVNLIREIAIHGSFEPACIAVGSELLDAYTLRHAAAYASPMDRKYLAALAGNPKTPPDVLEQLSRKAVEEVAVSVAGNANTPAHVLESLVATGHTAYLVAVAGNIGVPEELMLKLAAEEELLDVQSSVGANPSATADVLRVCAQSIHCRVRSAVAANANTPADVLDKLACDDDDDVRAYVAFNRETDPLLLGQLIQDDDFRVRYHASVNKSTPWHLRLKFGYLPEPLTGIYARLLQEADVDVRDVPKVMSVALGFKESGMSFVDAVEAAARVLA